MTLPQRPERPRHPPPAPPKRHSSRDRVRHMVKRHEAFDPERPPTWRGSSRDLVANPPVDGPYRLETLEGGRWRSVGVYASLCDVNAEIQDEPGARYQLIPVQEEMIANRRFQLNPGGFKADLAELVHDYYGKLRTDLTEEEVVAELERLFREEDTDDAMRSADELLEGHGVEALGPVNARDGAPYLYINFGDPYDATIMYSRDDNKVFVAKGGWGDVWQDEGEPNAQDEAWESYISSEFRRDVSRELEDEDTPEELASAFDDLSGEEERELFGKALYEAQNAPGNSRKYPEWVESSEGYSLMHLDVVVDKAAELMRGGWRPGLQENGRRRKTVFRVRGTADSHEDRSMLLGRSHRTLSVDVPSLEDAMTAAEKFMRGQSPVGRDAKVWIEESRPDGSFTVRGKWTAEGRQWRRDTLYTNPSVRRRGQDLDFHHDETTGVLAGAYRGRRNDFEGYKTHTVFCDSEGRQIGVACRQPLDNMADTFSASDEEKALPPTCPTCLRTWQRLHGGGSMQRNGDSPTDEFIERLKSELHIGDRQVRFSVGGKLGGASDSPTLFINYINLPADVGSAGGGAEAENNRMMFSVSWGPRRQGPYASDKPIPEGQVRIEQSVSALPREYRLRAKTGRVVNIAIYLANFLNKVASEVPPKFTHTRR